MAHTSIDEKKYSSRKGEITALSVCSNELGLYGKIDLYKSGEKLLIERKYQLKTIYQGQIYQLWAQYFCMTEMGYPVEKLAFYAISSNTTFPVKLPDSSDKQEFCNFIGRYRQFDPEQPLPVNKNKCAHCIYSNLCDKTLSENVYE